MPSLQRSWSSTDSRDSRWEDTKWSMTIVRHKRTRPYAVWSCTCGTTRVHHRTM
jgi:hypothetical protein